MIIDAIFPIWLIILFLAPFTILLLWTEWKQQHRFLILRTLSILLLMLSIAGILLRPKYRSEKSSSIILLTPGYSERKVDSLVQATGPTLIVMHTDNTAPYKNSRLLPYHDLPERGKEIRSVVGQGLPLYALDLIESWDFDFIPASLPKGITSLIVPPVCRGNRKNFVSGIFNSDSDDVRIYLNGPGGKEDSVHLAHKGLNNFNFSFTPKQSGNLVYSLSIEDGRSASHQEKLPIHVKEERSLNILIIQHYPTFETQYLKNFLSSKNQSVVVRNQLSKNNFRYEYINHDHIQTNRLTNQLLTNFDLLIIDQGALETLSLAEKNILKKSIHSGLGVLNLSEKFKNQDANALMPFKTISIKTDTSIIKIGSKSFNLPASRMRVVSDPSIAPIQKDKRGILSGYTHVGAGKIAFQFLQETYRLMLSGDSASYSELWTPFIEQVARPQLKDSRIKIVTPFPRYQNEPIDMEIISSKENLSLLDDSTQLPLVEDINIDEIWYARNWADSPGWHTLHTDDETSLPYYISREDEWKSLSVANQLRANKILRNTSSEKTLKEITTWKEVSSLLFYLIFLVSAGFIWLSPKL